MALIYHVIGAFDYKTKTQSQNVFGDILKNGLKSKAQLMKEIIVSPLPVQGIFSDEHENIYFWASQDSLNDQEDLFVAINVNPREVYIYNSFLRGAVDYFGNEASKMTLEQYLIKEAEYNNMENKTSSSYKQYSTLFFCRI